jgi:pimeloyl-ACP methyl ester carboxylesterase
MAPAIGQAADDSSVDRPWWSNAAEQALKQAGTNQAELIKALRDVPAAQREGMQFLVENMPPRDLESLSAAYLLENVAVSYEALAKAPWREQLSKEIFLNDVLPYASVNEHRDAWRKALYEKCAPLVADCRTPTEAAMRLNQKFFKVVNVRYSMERHRADQGPLETMESGKASCTGLSILLVDACRSIGVPARVAATPMWVNLRGNHTWVEIWDGEWHFTGACEQDPSGLDRGWFRHDASQALKDNPRHAIYASSFKKTGLSFPMVWARRVTDVPGLNVTDRYAAPKKTEEKTKPETIRLLVDVLDGPDGRRVSAKVEVVEANQIGVRFAGVSRDDTADRNDILPFEVPRERTYQIRAEHEGRFVRKEYRAGTNAQEIALLVLEKQRAPVSSVATLVPAPPPSSALEAREEKRLRAAYADFFAALSGTQQRWTFSSSLERLLLKDEEAVRRAAWEEYRCAPLHGSLRSDFEKNQVQFEKHLSPYTVKTVGTRPPSGWAMFIAMHGGGGTSKEVNDSQWQIMQRYYKDHPDAGGYLYVALRAPNNTWNGFYDVYVYPLVANLLRQFLLFADVDPNKVFLMGYSHGGYGAFAIGPKMPDRFAAVHASAAAGTDGETTARTLRNTVFSVMVGEKDTMYGRFERANRFRDDVTKLRGNRTDIYPVTVRIVEGNGHTGLPDRDKISVMYPVVRYAAPRELSWLMTDKVIQDFFWLHVPTPGKNQQVEALCHDNRVTIVANKEVAALTVLLDSRLVDFQKPVVLDVNGKTEEHRLTPSLRTLGQTLMRRGDPDLAFTCEVECPLGR